MAAAVDNASASAAGASVGSLTWTSHTIAGSERCLVVGVCWTNFAFATNVSGVTYGGVALTSAGTAAVIGNTKSQLWRLVAPATGTGSIVVTFSDINNYGAAGAVSFTGVDQTTPLGTLATGIASSTTPSVNVTAATGDVVVDALAIYLAASATVGAGQTQQWTAVSPGNVRTAGSTEDGAATTTMSWSLGGTSDWALSAVAVKAPAAAAGATFDYSYAEFKKAKLRQPDRVNE